MYVMAGRSHVTMIRLRDNKKFTLDITSALNPTEFGHISCRNIKRPAWCYISANYEFRLAAFSLDYSHVSQFHIDQDGESSSSVSSRVEKWGFHRSSASVYLSQPRASASPSGSQLIFSSDWYGTSEIGVYVLTAE